MQRYFVNAHQFRNNQFIIDEDDFHHIVHVLRMQPGEETICVTADGQAARTKIAEITDQEVILDVVQWEQTNSELPITVTIANGLPKGDKMELVIQKGTELGATKFIPFTAVRSIVKWDEKKGKKKVERWNKICKEAAEQSHRTILPEVTQPFSLKELLMNSKNYTHKIIAYEEEAKMGETANFTKVLMSMEKGNSLLVVFGPEGGLTDKEVESLKEHGFISCGLGPRILRTETAPLYALAAISYHFELMG